LLLFMINHNEEEDETTFVVATMVVTVMAACKLDKDKCEPSSITTCSQHHKGTIASSLIMYA
jgi:hypothetical protein